MRVFFPGLVLSILAASVPLLAETDPAEKGWEIFLEARQAAGVDRVGLHDYSYEMSTELEMQGRRVQMQSRVQAVLPDAFRQEIEGGGGALVMTLDGGDGWRSQAGAKQPIDAAAAQRARGDLARAHVLFGEPPPEGSVRYRGRETAGGREVDVIEIGSVGDTPLRLFIDPETHNVVKTVHVGDVPGGGMAQIETVLEDYVEVGGIRFPRKRRVLRNGQEATVQTRTKIEVNTGLTRDQVLR